MNVLNINNEAATNISILQAEMKHNNISFDRSMYIIRNSICLLAVYNLMCT